MTVPPATTSSSARQAPPRRLLRRAANVLKSNGQPIPALQEDTVYDPDQPAKLQRSISGSIKRGFQSASKSLRRLSSTSSSTPTPPLQRHHRSQSGVVDTRPDVARSKSAPGKYSLDHYRSALTSPNMSECSTPHNEFASPQQEHSKALDFTVPPLLALGTPMTKVSAKRQKKILVRLDPDLGQIVYESKKQRISKCVQLICSSHLTRSSVPIENIKELRSGSDARYYRQQFQLAADFEDRWITIIYVMEVGYKTLHLVALSKDVFQLWDITLRKMHAIRQQLMSGLGNIEMRQAVWEKQYWKSADDEQDQKLDFDDVEKMCHRLNINPSRDDMLRRFKTADVHSRGYLDFADFRRFVKALKARPELDRMYKKLCSGNGGKFDFSVFEKFMRENQKVRLVCLLIIQY